MFFFSSCTTSLFLSGPRSVYHVYNFFFSSFDEIIFRMFYSPIFLLLCSFLFFCCEQWSNYISGIMSPVKSFFIQKFKANGNFRRVFISHPMRKKNFCRNVDWWRWKHKKKNDEISINAQYNGNQPAKLNSFVKNSIPNEATKYGINSCQKVKIVIYPQIKFSTKNKKKKFFSLFKCVLRAVIQTKYFIVFSKILPCVWLVRCIKLY